MFTATVLVSPNVMVCGSAGTGCNRGRSCSNMSAGTRLVVRCTRPFTITMNAVQAASRSANVSYSSARFVTPDSSQERRPHTGESFSGSPRELALIRFRQRRRRCLAMNGPILRATMLRTISSGFDVVAQ